MSEKELLMLMKVINENAAVLHQCSRDHLARILELERALDKILARLDALEGRI